MEKITKQTLAETTNYTEEDARFMEMAIKLSEENVDNGGGPFGAVIVRDGEVISTGANRVVPNNDPTAHAEVTAIRNATAKLGTYDLSGCEIFTSCEPCPMCLGAIYWAHIDKIYYGNDRKDAAQIGFDYYFIYSELSLEPNERKLPCEILMPQEAKNAFKMWTAKEDRTEY